MSEADHSCRNCGGARWPADVLCQCCRHYSNHAQQVRAARATQVAYAAAKPPPRELGDGWYVLAGLFGLGGAPFLLPEFLRWLW